MRAAFFCMPLVGHLRRLLPLIGDLVRRGVEAHVFTHGDFREEVEEAGGTLVDIFARYPIERADDETTPVPCRYVSFAGHYAEEICRDIAALGPRLVVHDTFALIGRVVADRLGLPRVNVCAGHNVVPARFEAMLREDRHLRISRSCLRSVETLRGRFGLADASPFSFVSSPSRHLNVYCEPEQFIDEAERRALEPIAFYGSLPSTPARAGRSRDAPVFGGGERIRRRIYASFGTVVWQYFSRSAGRTLAALADSIAGMDDVRVVISLGAADVGAAAGFSGPNVSVQRYVDQRQALREADVFLTHHGLNSTHEAIFERVPMISYPFFWDQPAQSERCRRFGLAIPLVSALRGIVTAGDCRAALARIDAERGVMQAALSEAREWELTTIARRPEVIECILGLSESGSAPAHASPSLTS